VRIFTPAFLLENYQWSRFGRP